MASIYNIAIIGDSGVGKTAFLQRHLTGRFIDQHEPTQEVQNKVLTFYTNYGQVRFQIMDCPGAHESNKPWTEALQVAHGAIIMFDLRNPVSYQNVSNWIVQVPDIPKVVCGNKIDLPYIKLPKRPELGSNCKYYQISARSNYNFEKPFLSLAKELTGHHDLEFVEAPALTPPTVTVNLPIVQPQTWVSWINLPCGGKMKVTYELFP